MEITLGIIMSREFPTFSYHSEAVKRLKILLSSESLEFNSDLIKEISK